MSIFTKSVLNSIKLDESKVALAWANYQQFLSKKEHIKGFKEEEYQDGFLKDVFENCLGYTLKTTNPSNYSLEREKKNETDSKKADGVIYLDGDVVGVIELKDQKTKNLDQIEAQAFNYHNSHAKSRYIIISNFDELRFYIDKKTAYEKFSLFSLDYEEFRKLYLLLSYESIKSQIPLKLKEKTNNFEQQISKELYKDFSIFRNHLFENIVANNPNLDKSTLLRLTQKLCDRIIFILFAEDRGLLNPNTINEIRTRHSSDIFGNPMYQYYKIYFDAINRGNEKLQIPKYNGGLFATDELLDALVIDDAVLNMEAQKLSDYDFDSDVSVNILGHIFEQSLTDLEELQANIDNVDFDKTKSKRKKDGVFYTPEYITRYIVQNTLGKLCDDRKKELEILEIEAPKDSRKPTKKEQTTKENLEHYRNWLLQLKILDPACGSGAFLNQALEYLISEHKSLQENLAVMGDITAYYEIETSILEHNLYGVDINEDAVEIAKLSLWLRTASKGRELTKLADKIVCANSLLEMPFEEGSFDVVIGNPPYVRQESIKEQKEALSQIYKVANGTADLYVYFYELGIKMLKPNGLKGFICSNKFFRAKYGENLREYILENMTIESIADFNGVKVFEDATVDSAITIFKKQIPAQSHQFMVVDTNLEEYSMMNQSDLSKTSFSFANSKELAIKQKIEKIGTPLKEWDINIYRGVLTGFNEAFIIDGAKKDELIANDKKSAEIIKPIIRGRDIKKYECNFQNLYLIATFPSANIDINNYLSIKQYLETFGKAIEQSGEKGSRKKTNNKWFETQDSTAYYKEFKKEKIFYNEIGNSIEFYSSKEEIYCNNKLYFITLNNNSSINYLTSILNSKLLQFYFSFIFNFGGGKGKDTFKNIPIPKIEEEKQQPFIKLVDEILEAKQKIKDYKTLLDESIKNDNFDREIKLKKELETLENLCTANEKTIDKMVYELYGLSDDEIKIVENA